LNRNFNSENNNCDIFRLFNNTTTKNNKNYTNNYSDEQRSRAATLHLLSTYGRRINEGEDKEVLKKVEMFLAFFCYF